MGEPCLSAVLKQLVEEKNRLFVIQTKHNDEGEVSYYNKYRNKLNQLIRSVERKHHHNLLIEHELN